MLPTRNNPTPNVSKPAQTGTRASSTPPSKTRSSINWDEYEAAVRTPEDVRRFQETMEEERSFRSFTKAGLPSFRPHEGANQIRILPPAGMDWSKYLKYRNFGIKISTHWGIGAEGGKKQTVLCLSRSFLFKPEGYGNRCPVCEEKAALMAQGQKEAADKLRYQDRFLVWLIDRKASPESPNPVLWGIPASFMTNLQTLCVDRRTNTDIFVESPREGRDIWFTYNPPAKNIGRKVQPKGNNTYVGISIDPAPVALTDQEAEDYLEYVKAHPLDKCLDWQTYDEINAAFQGGYIESSEFVSDDDQKSASGIGNVEDSTEEAPF